MALICSIAYDLERNLGRAYREILERLKPEDHCVFLDHDACWTTRDWYKQILTAIDRYPDAGLFGAMCNRIGNKEQVPDGVPKCHDMAAHREFGLELQQKYGSEGIDVTNGHVLSGVVLCIPAAARAGLKIPDGFFGVDNEMHRAVRRMGKRVYILRGLYVQHWYRGDGVGHVNAPKARRTV
jgi:GT2 family glycosyltransferase